ncbi:AI-2E family transporter [Gaiella sp.]|jgi:predicted PurR-regulated permease PerM|uniref:AI-2E family transporter n=1 Tax=Gaiella sp. TaxID=2663207 RepID=UPI002E3593FA|nr:AI-2E family transporter [Gaiella sp.]HEX5584267.1 AI-2E family transporter [Gaiella sp.]
MATPERQSKRVEITVSARTIATVLGVIAFTWAFVAARQAVLWVFIALFLAIVLSTPVTWLQQRGMKRSSAALLVVLGVFAVFGMLGYVLVSRFVTAVRNLIEDLPSIVESIRASDLFQRIDERTDLGTELQHRAESIAADLPSKLGDVFEVGGKVFGLGLGALTISFMTLFLVIDLPNLSRSLHSLLYPRESARIGGLEERITRTIGRYALGAVVIAAIAGTVQGTAAWLIGVPFALALGVIAGLLGLIPQVGATLAAIVLSLVALTQGVPQALIMLGVCVGYQQLENYVLQPTIQGRAVEISGFFVIASVVVGAELLGIVGALIAVPLTASAQIVIRELTAERRRRVALAHSESPPGAGEAGGG